jgi:hypothetical protein
VVEGFGVFEVWFSDQEVYKGKGCEFGLLSLCAYDIYQFYAR